MSFAISSAYAYRPVYSGYSQAAARTSKAAALDFSAPVSPVPETYSNAQTERKHVSLEDISKEVLNVLEKMRSSANRNANFLNPKDFLIPPDELNSIGKDKTGLFENGFGASLSGTAGLGNAGLGNAIVTGTGNKGGFAAAGNAGATGTGSTGAGSTGAAGAGKGVLGFAGTDGTSESVYGSSEEADSDEPAIVYYDEKYAADDINHDGRISPSECSTCRDRMYVDGSDEDNVSFKAPGHIAPQASAAVVSAHEHEHVANAVAKGREDGVELLSASVSLQTAVCPECGTVYVSGGTTKTSFRETVEQ
jgi:hypothetical protein